MDEHTILDCVIVCLVRSTFSVKMGAGDVLYVHPYSDGGHHQYGRGFCSVYLEGDEVVVYGNVRQPHGGWAQSEVVRVLLAQPNSFEMLVEKIKNNLLQQR